MLKMEWHLYATMYLLWCLILFFSCGMKQVSRDYPLGIWQENNVEHFGKWNVYTCEHLVVRNALLVFMLCKSTFKYIRKKFQRSL